jgi:6-phospho-3-hexuloisomerase
MTPADRVAPILAEQAAVFARIAPETLEAAVSAIAAAPRVLLWAQGRTGYALMALAMRLFHLGRDAHWVAGITTPPLRAGDLLIANASRGDLPSTTAFLKHARALGARSVVLTGVEAGAALDAADIVLRIPAQTWEGASVLPMGGQYEIALWLFGELIVQRLMERDGMDAAALAARHGTIA